MDFDTPSPFFPHLNTNYVPPESEIYKLRNFIQSHQVVIEDINRQIRELEDRRQLHTTVVEQHSALLSPIKRMPPHILSLIFLSCLQDCHFSQGISRHPAVIISHVCQQWRTIALDSPLLWSKMHINVPYTSQPPIVVDESPRTAAPCKPALEQQEKHQLIKYMAVEWISRSAHCPMDITFSCGDSTRNDYVLSYHGKLTWNPLVPDLPQPSPEPVASFLVNLLLSVVGRWKRISFNLGVISLESPLLRLLEASPQDLSQLEDIHIALPLWYVDEIHRGSTPRISLLKAPQLRSLVLNRFLGPDATVPVNYSTLTELYLYDPDDFGGFSASNVLGILKACPNLVQCMVNLEDQARSYAYGFGPPTPWRLPNEKIYLPHLASMAIQGPLPRDFASSFNLPSLRTLSVLYSTMSLQNEEESGFVDWVRNFGDSLTNVSFEHSALTHSALLYALERLPNVVTLSMLDSGRILHHNWPTVEETLSGSAGVSNSLLARLTPPSDADDREDGGQYLCPRLQSFSCRLSHMEFAEHDLLGFIVGRRQPNTGSPLKRVVVKFALPQTMDIMEELECRGIDLEGFSAFMRYYQPFCPPPDPCLELLTPEDRMVADNWAQSNRAEWWWW
ncbi:hypothetical protein MD484_g5806, partial [Candolleomyces efflorescens]